MARELERHWEEALQAETEVKIAYERFLAGQPVSLSAEERETIRPLAGDMPALWHASTTTATDRQRLVRLFIEHVTVGVQGETEQVEVEVPWTGGHQSRAKLIRPVARLEQVRDYPALLHRVAVLFDEHNTSEEIAGMLNEEGWRPPKRRDPFTASMVRPLVSRQGFRRMDQKRPSEGIQTGPDEWSIPE